MFYTYIIFSKSLQVYYKGYSAALTQRLEKHNSGNSTYTSKVNDWEMVYWKSFLTKKEALIEEKRLKKLNVNSLQKLISEFKKDQKV